MSYNSLIREFKFKSEFSLEELNTKLDEFKKQLKSDASFLYSIKEADKKNWYTLDSDDFVSQTNYNIDKLHIFIHKNIFPGTSVDIIEVGEDGITAGVRITSKSISQLEFGTIAKRVIYPNESDVWESTGMCCYECNTEIGLGGGHISTDGVICDNCYENSTKEDTIRHLYKQLNDIEELNGYGVNHTEVDSEEFGKLILHGTHIGSEYNDWEVFPADNNDDTIASLLNIINLYNRKTCTKCGKEVDNDTYVTGSIGIYCPYCRAE